MHTPGTPICTLYPTREQHFREVLAQVKARVNEYMRRDLPEDFYSPRDEVEGFAFDAVEAIFYGGDNRSVLSLAVEDLSLVQVRPATFEVIAKDDDPPWPEYLIRTKFEELMYDRLFFYVREHPLCCEVCGRESAAWFWFPYAEQPDSSPELLTGNQHWGIGEKCKAVLDGGASLSFSESRKKQFSASRCLIPLQPEPEATKQDAAELPAIGTVPGNYRTLAQRIVQAAKLFDGWLAQEMRGGQEKMPETLEINNAVVRYALQVIPPGTEPLHLVLMAIEAPAVSDQRPERYEELVEANDKNITAALLLWCALVGHVSTFLRQRWQEQIQRE